MLEITSLWGGALVVGFGLTSLSVGLYRAGNNIMYGSGKSKEMEHLSRSQGNYGEYSPPLVLTLGLLEVNHVLPPFYLHVYGATALALRLAHTLQLRSPESLPIVLRQVGFLGTIALMVFGGGCAAAHAIGALK